jgi:hypothetical protein
MNYSNTVPVYRTAREIAEECMSQHLPFKDEQFFLKWAIVAWMGLDQVWEVDDGKLDNAMRIMVKKRAIRYRRSYRMWENMLRK